MEERINTITHNLTQKISGKPYSKNIKKTAKECFIDLLEYLEKLKHTHKFKDKSHTSNYVIGLIYKNHTKGKTKVEYRNYARQQICLAIKYLKSLKDLIEQKHGKLSFHSISKYSHLIHDFIIDLKPFIEHFEPSQVFFDGWKNYNHNSIEILRAGESFIWSSSLIPIKQKEATNFSVFALRQSLEIKFKRILGLHSIHNKNHNGPKVRHDFFINFISKNSDLLEFPDYNFSDLFNLYSWTNHCIHNAVIPRVWELMFAYDYVREIFNAGKAKVNGKTILAVGGNVKIKDYQVLKERLCLKIGQECSIDEIYCVSFMATPEAIVLK